MGCGDVQRVIYFFLDGSLSDRKLRDFSEHVSICPECDSRTRIQRSLRQFVRKRLAPVPAPTRFRTRLQRALRALCTD